MSRFTITRSTTVTSRPLGFALSIALAALALLMLIDASMASANGVPLKEGDVLAGVGSAQVKNFSPTGTLQDTLTDNTGAAYTTGMCFDSEHNLYVTDFAMTMSKYSDEGNVLISPFSAPFASGHPESCTVDASNNIYAGGPSSASIEKLNTSGELLESIPVESAGRTGGTDWVDLAADQCTIYYTGEGSVVDRYNVCTKTQEAPFASGLPEPCFALRIRPNGEVLVACGSEVVRLNTSGEVVQTYPIPGHAELFALNLDPDGTTFWTGDIDNGEIYHLDIETGATVNEFNSSPNSSLAGLAVVGEIAVSAPSITLIPPSGEDPVGTTHTVTATVSEGGKPQMGVTVTFKATGPNAQTGTGTTNASGEATFTYTGEHAGTDTIVASFINKSATTDESNAVTETWTEAAHAEPTSLSTTLSGAGKSGGSISVPEGTVVKDSATLSGENASSATGEVTYKVYSNSECTALVTSAGSVSVSGTNVPSSNGEQLAPGTYYWQASYGGDSANEPSTSPCGSEVETVTAVEKKKTVGPSVDGITSAQHYNEATAELTTEESGDLIVAFVAADSPFDGGQTSTVSGGGLTWTLVGRDNTARGDAEIWVARASGVLTDDPITAAVNELAPGSPTGHGYDETITVVAFKNAPGIGPVATFDSTKGAASGTLTTTQAKTWVWAIGDDWLASVPRKVPGNQKLWHEATDPVGDTYWVQSTKGIARKAGKTVKINDPKPKTDPFDLVLVDIL
ncbi:MAG TPA: Ig-like domain-containing protein [Solirubrobacteraceae bacterium]|nr:Ig-like domain-containing protein [Solirubrobacteraceae bacterium]